jgi:hypothetical protein
VALAECGTHTLCHAQTGPYVTSEQTLEPVYDLLSTSAKKAKWMNCRRVLSFRSQFFQSLRFSPSQAKRRSTIQRLGMTLKVRLVSFGDPHGEALTQNIAHALHKRLAHIAAIGQKALRLARFRPATIQLSRIYISVSTLKDSRGKKQSDFLPRPSGSGERRFVYDLTP